MASSYTVLGTEKMTTGENAGDWGSKLILIYKSSSKLLVVILKNL